MPFQSEAQRRYLWANEPEIARDWTDTYGSKIHAANGGIMRLGLRRGGPGPGGQGARGQATQNPGVGGRNEPPGGGDPRMTYQPSHHIQPHGGGGDTTLHSNITKMGAPPGMSTTPTHTPQTKGFFGNLGRGIKDYIMGGGMIGMGIRGLGSLLGGPRASTGNVGPAGLKTDGTYGTVQDAINTSRRNETPLSGGDGQQQYPPWLYDNAYAQNIVDDEELDIDTSTGDMEEWIQRFRVKDPYRQDQGGLDEQIKEYVSKLYT